MTLFLTTGQMMRAAAGYIQEQRRYFSTSRTSKFPTIDTTLWHAAPSLTTYDPDGLAAPWGEITHLVDDSQTHLRMWDDGAISRWQVTLSGWQFNSDLIGHDQGVMCLRRLWPDVENADGWSSWRLWWLGYFKADTITHDYRNAGEWTATVEGVGQYLAKTRARAEVLGKTDLALNASVRTSALLANMAEEAHKGEFLGLPANSGQNLTDGDDAVPVISANEPTPAPTPYSLDVQDGTKLRIDQVFLTPFAGFGTGFQWLTIVNIHSTAPATLADFGLAHYDQNGDHVATVALDKFFLSAGQGWAPSGAGLAQDLGPDTPNPISITNGGVLQGVTQVRVNHEPMQIQSVSPGSMNVSRTNKTPGFVHAAGTAIDKAGDVQSPTPTVIPPKGFLIICENRRRFEEMFSVPPGALVIEWRDQNFADGRFGGIAPSAMRLDETQGSLRLLAPKAEPQGTYGEIDRVTWGTGLDDGADGDGIVYAVGTDGNDKTAWSGARVAVPAAGFSIRRIAVGGGADFPNKDGHTAADWVAENVPTPGRQLAGSDANGQQVMADTAWFSVQLPALTCELAQDLNDGDTTVVVNNTGGFYADQERNILIVATPTAYIAKTADTFTLAEAWAGGNVPAGTRLYPLDASGQAHDAWPIGSVKWTRKQEPVPASYSIYVSTLASPVYPDDGEWHDLKADDWTPVVQHRQTDVATLTQSVNTGDTVVYVDSTNLWPFAGILTLKYPNADDTEIVNVSARYKAITATAVVLSSPWALTPVPVGARTFAVATLSPGLSQEHVIVGPGGARVRARHVLMVVDAMSNLGRFKLNSFHVYPNMAATADPDKQVDNNDVADFVRYLLVDRFGLPASKFSSVSHALLPEISSRETTYVNQLQDLAESTASHVRLTLADGARWRPLPELGGVTGDDEDDVDWTFHISDYTQLQGIRAERNTVAQVRMKYRVSGQRDVRALAYPNSAEMQAMNLNPNRGAVYDVPKTVTVADDATALKLARVAYQQRAAPVRVTLRLPFPASDWLHPLAVCGLEVDVDASTEAQILPALWGKYVVRTLDEYRSGQFPNAAPHCDIGLERIGLL